MIDWLNFIILVSCVVIAIFFGVAMQNRLMDWETRLREEEKRIKKMRQQLLQDNREVLAAIQTIAALCQEATSREHYSLEDQDV